MLPYVIHSLAHDPSFPNSYESKDAKTFEAMYRYFRLTIMIFKFVEILSGVLLWLSIRHLVSSTFEANSPCPQRYGMSRLKIDIDMAMHFA